MKASGTDTVGQSERSDNASPSLRSPQKLKANVEWTEYEDDSVVKETFTMHTTTPGNTKSFTEEHVLRLRSIKIPTPDTVANAIDSGQRKEDGMEKMKRKVCDCVGHINSLVT